jgi:hypothetical protein
MVISTDRLLGELLGASEATVSLAVRRTAPVLEQYGITARPGQPRITTLSQLREHAEREGITINGI